MMDAFYGYLKRKYFVDFDDREVRDIYYAVKTSLVDFQERLNKLETCGLKIETIFPCGSMSEQTSIWLGKHNHDIWKSDKDIVLETKLSLPQEYKCIEFDFLGLLEPLAPDMKTVPTCTGHAKISSDMFQDDLSMNQLREQKRCGSFSEADVIEDSKDTWENENVFQKPFEIIRREFYESVVSTVNQEHAEDGSFKKEMETGICTLEFLEFSSDAPILFKWVSKVPERKDHVIVGKLDFIPAFRTTHLPNATFIVGKHCSNHMRLGQCSTSLHCESNCSEQCWRLSQSTEEAEMIRQSSQVHRDLYRIIKIFCDKMSRHHYYSSKYFEFRNSYPFKIPTSYHIKTALIHHIKNCDSSTSDVTKCLRQVILSLKEYGEKGQILNWKGTFHLGIEPYEIYFWSVLWLIFSQADDSSDVSQSDKQDCLSLLDPPGCLKNMVTDLMDFMSGEKPSFETVEKKLECILACPLWDYAMAFIQFNCNLTEQDRCDFQLERTEQVYACNLPTYHSEEVENSRGLRKSHSESDLSVLYDYLDDKNFDKNWENIYSKLRLNNAVYESFTQAIKQDKLSNQLYTTLCEDLSPWDFTEKQAIISMIKEEEDFWFDMMQRSFEWFSLGIDNILKQNQRVSKET